MATFLIRARSAAGTALVLSAIVAVTMGPAPTVDARQPAQPNYVFETLFDVRPDALAAFDRYWSTLKEITHDGADGPRRFVDGAVGGSGRRVTLPVIRLAEYGFDRRNEAVLRAALGEQAAATLIQQFNEAQISRTSYLRQYRNDLSVRRERDARTPTTEVAYVTVLDGKEPSFERAWRRVIEAYRKVHPEVVISVSRTLVGGGPQYVIVRPVPDAAHGPIIRLAEPSAAVLEVHGPAAAHEVAAMIAATGAVWRIETYRNLGFDTAGDEQVARHQ